MPFDDLDAIDMYAEDGGSTTHHDQHASSAAMIGTWRGQAMYPTPMVFRYGEACAPLPSDLIWLTRGIESVNALLRTAPSFLPTSTPALVGALHPDDPDTMDDNDNGHVAEPKVTREIPTLTNERETVVIRNSTVLSMQDVAMLRKVILSRRQEPPHAQPDQEVPAATASSSSSSLAANAMTKEKNGGNDHANHCVVM